MVLDGKAVSHTLKKCLRATVQHRISEGYRPPNLAIIQAGYMEASNTYIKWKMKDAEEIGIEATLFHFSDNEHYLVTKIQDKIKELNATHMCDGIIVQLPIPGISGDPDKYYETQILSTIAPEKDVDGLRPDVYGLIAHTDKEGKSWWGHSYPPCTPDGVMTLLHTYGRSVAGKNCVVVGRSNLVGRPLAQMLLNEDATVTQLHSRSNGEDVYDALKHAEYVFFCAGRPKHWDASCLNLNKHPVIIDISTTPLDGKLTGDCNLDGLKAEGKLDLVDYTPVPGGIGPMTRYALMEHTVTAYERKISEGYVYRDASKKSGAADC